MKKFLIGSLLLISACQGVTPSPAAESTPISASPIAPQPATATVTSPPAPTLSPTAVPLYFTEEFNSPDTGAWLSFQTGGESMPRLGIENGLLRFDLSSPDSWYYAIHGAHDYEDVNVSAKFSGPPSGSSGLICRYSENGWYEFNIASDGTYSVLFGQTLGDGIASYLPIAGDSSEYLDPGVMDYEIGLTCQKNFLSLYINGKLFRNLDVSRYALTDGRVGVATASFKEFPVIVTLDWFQVKQVDP